MKEIDTLVDSIFRNKETLTALTDEAVSRTEWLLAEQSYDVNNFEQFMTTYLCEFETIAVQFIAHKVLELGVYSERLINGSDFEDFLYQDVKYIVENNLHQFDKKLCDFFNHLVTQNFPEANELLPNVESDYLGLCAYANRESDFQNYLLENQTDFSTRDLMDDLANYNSLKI
ncbi:MAG: hypothetical protein K2V71_06870 [Methylotenera sp.]|nr:hypothetical protein [Methylotenera sp.]